MFYTPDPARAITLQRGMPEGILFQAICEHEEHDLSIEILP
jgi:hypothetical protein